MPFVVQDSETRERITSFEMDAASWDALSAEVRAKRRQLVMPCCGAAAATRTSPLGLRHFYHRNAKHIECEHKSESADHLALKMLVIAALVDAGWQARPEHIEANWRADVLAIDGDRRVAFEVQLAPQTGAETRRRHERYKASSVHCVWLMKRAPADISTSAALPIFKIAKEKESGTWLAELERYPDVRISITDLVAALAERRAAYRPLRAAHLDISVYNWRGNCYRCDAATPLVLAYAQGTCRCGRAGTRYDQSDEAIGQLIAAAITSGTMQLPLAGSGLRRRNSRMAGGPQWANTCANCGAMQGNFFLSQEIRSEGLKPAITGRAPLPAALLDEDAIAREQYSRHWCVAPPHDAPINPPAAGGLNAVRRQQASMTIEQVVKRFTRF